MNDTIGARSDALESPVARGVANDTIADYAERWCWIPSRRRRPVSRRSSTTSSLSSNSRTSSEVDADQREREQAAADQKEPNEHDVVAEREDGDEERPSDVPGGFGRGQGDRLEPLRVQVAIGER